MFPQFGATAETLSKASTMVFRIGTDAHLYDDPEDVNIASLLDSKFDTEKCEALKRLLALIAQGFDVCDYFPQVVKNVASQSLEVKKLVYLYLLHYAEKRPNEALLSINYFQKDLGDTNPLVRAWALRAMAGIRLLAVAPLVLIAVGKCARDPSVYVRKCAANALPKLYDLHLEENTSAIEEIVGILLNDHSPGVVGAAAAAFASVCPNNLPLIGKHYRRLCETLPDVEEWGQIVLIGILLRYLIAKHGLVKDSIMFSSRFNKEEGVPNNDYGSEDTMGSGLYMSKLANLVTHSYIEGADEFLSRSSNKSVGPSGVDNTCFTDGKSNEDVKILLKCTSPLLWSQNSAVVLAAAVVHWIMSPREDVKSIVKPLLFVLRSSNASKYVVLCNIQVFAKAMPALFASYYEDFFICSSDSHPIKALKLEILSSVATDSSVSSIFQEIQDYVKDPDRRFAADTVAVIGLCGQRLPKVANTCLEMLLALIRQESVTTEFGAVDGEELVLIQAIMSIKRIIQQDPPSHEKVIIHLVRSLDSIKVPAARALIIWMMGEYNCIGQTISRILATVVKYLGWCFTSEAVETKLQILTATAKVLLCAKGEELLTYKRVLKYLLDLATCDSSYDVRDRARFVKTLLSCHLDQYSDETIKPYQENYDLLHKLAECIFVGRTRLPAPESINFRFYLPGSLSQIVLHAAPGYDALPRPCTLLSEDSTTSSGSLNVESSSGYSSQDPSTSSKGNSGSDESETENHADKKSGPLIQISDVGKNEDPDEVDGLLSKSDFESWLDEETMNSSKKSQMRTSSARISLGDIGERVKAKTYPLLDPTNGNGLRATYSFLSDISSISPLLICVEVSFENCSQEPMENVNLVDEESQKGIGSVDQEAESSVASHNDVPTLVSMEEITSLEPGDIMKRTLQVCFHHHLLPLKLTLWYSGKRYPVKLRPDIGYFVKPLPMEVELFTQKESQLPGMFEYVRRCTFTDHIKELSADRSDNSSLTKDKFLVICKSLALKMLSNSNLFLVSVDMPVSANFDDASGLKLRFSAEIISNSMPCLTTITVEGKCSDPLNLSLKVNCEETVFGLNLLNRVVSFLVEPSPYHV